MLTFVPMNELYARAIVCWRYDPPYDVYDPGAGDVEEKIQVLLDPQYAYRAILSPEDELVAYCCFGADARVPGGDYDEDALDIGLGVRPDRTGHGQGSTYVRAVLDYACSEYAPTVFRVTIAEFNVRAQRVWEQAGFQRIQHFCSTHDGRPFLILVRKEEPSASRPERMQ